MTNNKTSSVELLLERITAELNTLVEANPFYIPIDEAAKFLHMKPDCLRASISQKKCPFRFSWAKGDRESYKIPTITFYLWFTGGKMIEETP